MRFTRVLGVVTVAALVAVSAASCGTSVIDDARSNVESALNDLGSSLSGGWQGFEAGAAALGQCLEKVGTSSGDTFSNLFEEAKKRAETIRSDLDKGGDQSVDQVREDWQAVTGEVDRLDQQLGEGNADLSAACQADWENFKSQVEQINGSITAGQ